jgi:hypothetical protein
MAKQRAKIAKELSDMVMYVQVRQNVSGRHWISCFLAIVVFRK